VPDLRRLGTSPNYSFITPDLCNDGHDEPCENGQAGGMKQANSFLRRWIPRILRSKAFRDRGLLIVTFDEAEGGESPDDDGSACCDEPTGPNTPFPGALTGGPGGGRIGAVMVSPCIRPKTVTLDAYNHYSMLRSIENNFGLLHLGYAGQQGLDAFGADILNRRACGERIRLRVRPRHPSPGELTTFRFRVRAVSPHCISRVRIRFAGLRTRTGPRGRATIRTHLDSTGRHRALATKAGCRRDRARVRTS
jgi:hypothetical protein